MELVGKKIEFYEKTPSYILFNENCSNDTKFSVFNFLPIKSTFLSVFFFFCVSVRFFHYDGRSTFLLKESEESVFDV